MKLRGWIIVLTLIALPGFASGEFYRYVDQEGKTHYTDDIANIPADQRPHVSEYEDVSHRSSLKEETETTTQEEESREAAVREAEVLSPPQRASAVGEDETKTAEQRLKEIRSALEQEYQALMEVREQLDEAAKRPLTPTSREKLVQKIRDFNARSKDYNKRREAFDQDVEAYNAGIEDKGQPSEGETN
jgi:hypothetical protein